MLILGVTFLVLSQYSFPRLQLHVTKKYEIIFVPLRFCLRLLKKGLKSMSQNLKISVSQTGNSNIFVLCGVICYVQHLEIKSSFSSENKTRTVESGTHVCTKTP